MSESEEDDIDDFERQLKLEEEEKERRKKCSNIKHGSTRTDPDGTIYEWDADKMAYFPKIDADFIAQYQMNYGEYKDDTPTETEPTIPPPSIAGNSGSDWTEYFAYAQKYVAEHGDYPPGMTQVHKDYYVYYYNYYYGNKGSKTTGIDTDESEGNKTENDVKDTPDNKSRKEDVSDKKDEEDNQEDKEYQEYYEYYKDYWQQHVKTGKADDNDKEEYERWAYYNYYYGDWSKDVEEKNAGVGKEEGEKGKEDEEKANKRKTDGWFEIEENKNTNVYVTGLPEDVTDEEFEALMNKCGMITLDPRTRKLKLKLYRHADGKPKGDGLCCYIKPESVDLALQVLDESDVRGHKITVERAKFQLKGSFDPKRRKKLSNKEKKRAKEHQEKLLDWRPDKPKGYRAKNEKVLIIKNAFDPSEFEGNPAKIQHLREDIRAQCTNFGVVKKVQIYDRHPEGVVTVGFAEPEEADQGKESLHGRYFRRRQITVETWDGKTKYDVKETEQEKEARIKNWATFLESGEEVKVEDKSEPTTASDGDGDNKKTVALAESAQPTDDDRKVDVESNTQSETETKSNNATDDNSKMDVESTSQPETETRSDNAIDDNSKMDVESTLQLETETKSDKATDGNSKIDVISNTQSETETKSDKATDDNSKIDDESTTHPETETKSDKATDDNSKMDVESTPQLETETKSDKVNDDNSKKDVDSNTQPETETKSDKATDGKSKMDVGSTTQPETETQTPKETQKVDN